MAEEVISEKKQSAVKNWRQIQAICSATLSAFCGSILYNWVSPSIPRLISDEYPEITEADTSYLPIIPAITTIIASPCFGYFLNKFGRKYTLLSISVFHIISYALIATAETKWEFYLSRIFFGMSDVFMFGSLPIYIAEVSTPKVRGTWGGSMMIFVFFGQFLVNAVGYYCDIPTAACILVIAPIVFFVNFAFMPETPYHYLLKNKREDAIKSLRRLRGYRDVDEELERIEADIRRQVQDATKFKDLFLVRSNRNAFFIVFMVIMIQQFSGCAAFNVYNQYIFQHAGQNINRGHSSMIYSIILAVATLCGPSFVEKVGRKKSLVISCFTCCIILSTLALYFLLNDEKIVDLSFMNWFPLVGMIAYVMGFAMGLSVVPSLLQGELFATNMRGHASAAMNVTLCFSLSITSKLFHFLMSSFGMYVPYAFFCVCSLVGMGLCYKFVPETKGKTLEEIQQLMKKRNSSVI